MMGIISRFQRAWNTFANKDPTPEYRYSEYSIG